MILGTILQAAVTSPDLTEIGVFRDTNPLVILSRIMISLAWVYGLVRIWRFRHLPHANQALSGALAHVLANACLLFKNNIPGDVLLFFVGMSQFTLAVAFTRLFGLLKQVLPSYPESARCIECPHAAMANPTSEHRALSKAFTHVVLLIGALSIGMVSVQHIIVR